MNAQGGLTDRATGLKLSIHLTWPNYHKFVYLASKEVLASS